MLRSLSFLLAMSLLLYWYATVGVVCQAPLTYTLATPIDEHFNLSEREVIETLKQAEDFWENVASRELFTYVASTSQADVIVSFVYDERHKNYLAEKELRGTLEDTKHSSADIQKAYEDLTKSYKEKRELHEASIASYEDRLEKYNATVASYNEAGGAPADVFQELEQTKTKLEQESLKITAEADELSKLADEVNKLGDEGNKLIREYNAEVSAYNSEYGEPDEFIQGDYKNGSVRIYTFKDKNELLEVVAHEFGHALDINHVEGNASVMYYLLEDQPTPLVPSIADKEAFISACGESGHIGTKVRTLINRYVI